MSTRTAPESFNKPTDHFMMIRELIIAANVSIIGISHFIAQNKPIIAAKLVSASEITWI